MNTKRMLRALCQIAIMGLALLGGGGQVASAPASADSGPLATVQIEPDQITWQPLVSYARLTMTVSTPDGTVLTRTFMPGKAPTLELVDSPGSRLADGHYTYELRLTPALDAETQAALAAVANDAEARIRVVEKLREAGKLPQVTVMGGTFAVREGHFVVLTEQEGGITPNDVVHADDVIVTGSICVGFDCLTDGTENFGFDTIKLKENNLRIFFDDTSSTAGFPANDWRIITNDSASGGANYFAIEDSTAARMPFRIEAGAPNNALYVRDTGRIGLGTSTPVVKLHLVLGDTPAIRLDQDTSSGWTAQVWDVAGNESNFFVRDTTGGSKLPFRIQPGAPTNSITAKADGKIGFGTWSPAYAVELEKTGEDAVFAADRTDGATAILSAGANSVRIGSATSHDVALMVNNSSVMTLTSQGNMTLDGALGTTARLFPGMDSVQIGSATSDPLELLVNNTPVVTLTDQGNLTLTGALSATARLSASANSVQIGSATSHDVDLVVNNSPVITVKADGKIGFGTVSPAYAVELEKTGEDAVFAADRTDGATAILSADANSVQIGSATSHDVALVVNNSSVMTLTGQGNVTLAGALSEYSDVNAKKNLALVNGNDVLKRLTGLQIMTWNYKADDANVQHMGPMAQDFYAAFGLGPDNQHIAALDANGVSLAAIQALTQVTTEQDARITQLEDENAELKARLTALEDLVKALLAQQSK
jgi:Chaperone of endosialidase